MYLRATTLTARLAATVLWLGMLCPARATAEPAKLIAHRGGVVDDERIENSLAAVEEAVRRGFWMIEVDVRESKDGHLVVHHDVDFMRYYGDARRVADLTWAEIAKLRSNPGGHRPLEFHEIAAACRGKMRVMIDTKEPEHDSDFFEAMEKALRENGLLESAYFIGTEQSQAYFKGKVRTSITGTALRAAIEAREDVGRRYFLFEHGSELSEATVRLAQGAGVPVVPSVNVFHYPEEGHALRAADDIRRLRKLGVTVFQIDSVYEKFCRN